MEIILSQRLLLHLRLETWKSSISPAWSPVLAHDLETSSIDAIESAWHHILLSIHYRRAQLLINRPAVLFTLREWVFGDPLCEASTETLVRVLQEDYKAAKELVSVVNTSLQAENFLRRHNIWFLVNYSVFAACVHMFGHLLACGKERDILFAAEISLSEVRGLLQTSLELLKRVGARSLMSQKGAACLLTFLDVFDAFVATEMTASTVISDQLPDPSMAPVLDSSSFQTSGLLSDFIVQATDDFFFDGHSTNLSYDQYGTFS
ncbi:uncharacterized protein HMPREF1541_08035 [Cyphellophora europaea CBS 101466]|uniref:Transcription factor domain-containing protein n=1 Tax=Cyphellophora europaea (strain CBS 101466) TaxID=1220924 RepID=W2RKN6_CYPE1|nr:uncharacterized protein HMPREF1541_08035 [Cyphellophora europaea CBS 101466]ETN37046.1 hypothetical protein HMPREF1541_08035 [Cyphellophora europaea CBS 101466]